MGKKDSLCLLELKAKKKHMTKAIKNFVLLALLVLSSITYSQNYLESEGLPISISAKIIKNTGDFKKGESLTFDHVIQVQDSSSKAFQGSPQPGIFLRSRNRQIEVTKRIDEYLDLSYSTVQDFWDVQVIRKVMPNRIKEGFQTTLRAELEEDALKYFYSIKDRGNDFNDPYLESYIYTLVNKIAPTYLVDDRSVNINLLLLDDPSMNACCFPNGTIVINTGLLSQLHTEEELVAILSHEIAHFVMDHSVRNINEIKERESRANFWAGFATALAAVGELAIASNNKYYKPGAITTGVAAISFSAAQSVVKRFGMEYSQQQETEADNAAVQVLKLLGYDENAMATALNRMKEVYKTEHNDAMYYQSDSHPSLISRINNTGKPAPNKKDASFEKMVSFAVTDAAMIKYLYRRFSQVLPLVNQNIKNNVATADDYILKADCVLSLYNTEESNKEVLELINKAKQIEPDNINIYKSEIIALLRQDQKKRAQQLLEEYVVKLNTLIELNKNTSESRFNATFAFAQPEISWARRMIVKLKE